MLTDAASGRWTIETPNLSIALRQDDSGEVMLASLRTAGQEWVASEHPLFVMGGSGDPPVTLRDAAATATQDGGLRLEGRLAPTELAATVDLTPDPEHSVVVAALRIRNDTNAEIEVGSLSSLCLRTVSASDRQLHVLAGGRWNEANPPRGYRLESYDLDELRRLPEVAVAADGRSSGEYVPWFALSGAETGLLAALVWSGRWRLAVDRTGAEATLALGIADFTHRLAPGEELDLPGYVLAGLDGDLDDGANSWRAWMGEHWTPETPENWPWVQYNHWYAYYGDIDETRLAEEAKHAASVGSEVFVIDDGWFIGRRPDSYHEGWGNWHEDPAKFPNGLRAFGDHVRKLGMRFGLWVEPERADPDGQLVQEHPEYVATRDGKPITRLPDGTGGVHLCLGNPDVQDWMTADMIRVVQDYGLDWLKWDYNLGYGLGCNNSEHGHQAGDGHYAHTMGLYRVLEQLRAACPDLVIENCASGGHRLDLGTVRHSHTNWLSDYTSRASSCRQHAQGAGLVVPIAHLNTWVLHDRDTYEFRSRMGGAFGFSSFMGTWSETEREELKNAVADYKRLRPLLAGSRYLLSGALHESWDIWQFVDANRDNFAVLAFHEHSSIQAVTVIPRGLDPGRMYRVQLADGEQSIDIAGADLLADGLELRLKPFESTIVWGTISTS